MKKKPFYKIPIAYISIKRNKYNPMRLLLGDTYYVSNFDKRFFDNFNLDTKDIIINEQSLQNPSTDIK